jgi:hypothetical protein
LPNSQIALCNEAGKYVTYKTDRYGYNNPDRVWDSQSYDAVLIGDSYTEGYCVEQGHDIASQLRRLGLGVLNLGIGGYGPLGQIAAMREFGNGKSAKLAFWIFCEANDFGDLKAELGNQILKSYLEPDFSQGLATKMELVSRRLEARIEKELSEEIESERAIQIRESTIGPIFPNLRRFKTYFLASRHEREEKHDFDEMETLAVAMREEVKRRFGPESKLVFVYLPLLNSQTTRASLTEIMTKNHISVIDLTETMKSLPDPMAVFHLQLTGHYNEWGYSLISKSISQFISGGQRNNTKKDFR